MKRGSSLGKNIRLWLVYAWRPAILMGFLAVLLYFLLWFKLGTLTGGISSTEAIAQSHLALRDISFKSIIVNPLYLPYSVVLYVLQALGLHGPTALRGVSAMIGSLSAIAFYLLIRRWHTPRIAIFGTLLFTTSSWFLHLARYGSTDILYIGIIPVLLTGVWLQQSRYRRLMLIFVLLASTMYLYVPGMIWFIFFIGIWQAKRLKNEMKRVDWWFNILIVSGGLVFIFPLFMSVINDPSLLKPLLGLPANLPKPLNILSNLIEIPKHIFVSGPDNPAVWLPGTSYLDIFSAVMLIIGIYWSAFKIRLDRVRVIFGVIMLGSVLIVIGGPVSIALLLAPLYIIITSGMTFMLQQWYTVFPRNPIARTTGTLLLSIAVLVTVFYHINHYFIAWPNTPSVREAFSNKPLIR